MNEPPIVDAVRNREGNLTISCPYCSRTHTHGGGGSLELGAGDGHRVSHCTLEGPGRDAGYVVREIQNPSEGKND